MRGMRRIFAPWLALVLLLAAGTANAAITFTRTSSATFYTDTSVTPTIVCNYQSFAVQSSTAVADLWVSASSFTGSLYLGGNDDGIEHLGAFTAGQTRYAFFYVCSSNTANSATGGFTLAAYDRSPSLTGAVNLGSSTQSYTIDNTLIQAGTNQVTTIFAGPNPSVIGGTITMTVEGDTGTIGSAPGPNGPFSFTPATYTNWRADAYELYAANISFSGGNSGSYDNQLFISGLASSSTTHYVATYYFRALGGTSVSTQLSPIVDIASGTQMKHTDTTKGAYGTALLPIEPASNSLLLSKLVSAATLPASGGTVTYTLRVSNNSSYAIILMDDFQDTLPAGAAYVNNSSSFGGVAIANPTISGQVLTWNAPFSIAAGATVDLVFQATLPGTPALYTNSAIAHIGTTVIDTTYSTTDNVPATATTRVLATPTVTKAFNPVATAVSSTSTLTITIANPNAANAIAGVAISDTYPAGLVNAATPNAATTCTGATISGGAAGGNTIGITGGTLAGGASCTVSVTVSSSAAGTYSNTTGTVSSTTAGTGGTASANVTFTTKPTILKSFSPAIVPLGTSSTVTLVVTNNNNVSLTGVALTDTLPAGMSVVASPAATNTCGGTLAGTFAGSGSVSLSGGAITLPAKTCQVTFAVAASSAGVYANTTAGATSNETGAAGPASNTANLTVMSAPTVAKGFNVASMGRGQTATLTITLGNTNPADITGAAFTDTYPANLVNANPASGATTCTGGIVTAANGGGSVALSGATIPANGSCTVTVNVTSSTAATYTNTIASGAVTATNAPASTAAASAQVIVNNTPTLAKSFSTNTGTGVTTLSLVITNNATTGGVSSLAFTDTFPSGLIVASTPALTNSCGGTVTGATSGSGSISLSGGSIAAAGGTCTITVAVISNVQGTYDNTSGGVSSSLGTGSGSNTATYIAAGLIKSFSPNTTGVGDTSRMTITVFNPSSSTTLTGTTFSDTYPSGMTNTASPSVTNTCGGTVGGGAASGTTISLSGASLAPGATCSVSVNVSANAVNSFYNATGNVATNQGVGVNGADTLYITAKPTITKSFSPATITVGGTSTLTIGIENNNGSNSISALALSDPFPAGLVVASTPAVTNNCGGTVSGATSGSSTISLTGGALAANAKCTITVAVTSATAAAYSNQTNGATSTETGATPGPKSNVAVLTVNLQAPTVTKSFATSPVGISTGSVMTITLQNPNVTAITGVNFTDTYPSGLVNSGTPNLTSTCSGDATAAAGTNSLALVAGTIPASGSCTVSVSVQSATAGTYVNNTGAVTASNANTAASATATLVVLSPLTVAKGFAASPVGPGVATAMTITLTNPNAQAVTGVAFTDTYPAGLANTATPAGATTCAPGSVTAAANGNSVSLSGGTIPANGSCTVTVNVAAATGGTYTNTLAVGAVTSANAGSNNAPGSGTLNVNTALTATKAFNPASIGTGDTSVMTITLTNPNATAATSVAFTDTYPASLANTASANAATTCGGTVTGANNGTSLSLSGATIAANGSCTVTVNVTSATAGSYANSTGTITSANAGTATASGTLTVLAHPTVTKAFSPTQVALNGASTLVITLQNTNAAPIIGAAFTDTYPANLLNAATPSASSTCAGATITANAGAGSIAVSGATIPANSNCTVQVNVTPTATGALVNTLAAGAVTSANAGASTAAASATLNSQAPLTVAKSFNLSSVGANVPSVLRVTLTNPNAVAVTGVTFSDAYPAGLANTATPNGATTCTAGTVTAGASGTSLAFSGGTVPANGSCTVTVNVAAAAVGSYTNTLAAGAVTATNAGPSTAPASDTLNVLAAVTVAKSFSPPSIGTNDTSVMTITLTNGNATAVSGAAFTDTYPAGLVNTASASGSSSCGGTVTAANNGTSLALSGATIPANSSCTVTANVTSASTGSYVNSTGAVATTNAGSAAAASGTLAVLAHPTIAKSFGAAQVPVNGATLLTFTLSNTNATAVTGAAFTDTYPAGLQNAATPNASTTCAGASITAAANGNGISVGGATIPTNGSCTVQVTVTPTATGSLVNTLAAGALTSTNAGATAGSSTATLVSMAPLTVAKGFAASPVGPGVATAMTITLTNPNAQAVTGVAFTDTYPAGLANTATPAGATTCSAGTVTAAANATSVSFSGGTVPANASCTVTVNVAAATGGTYTNTLAVGAVTSANAGSNNAPGSGTLNVNTALTATKAFSPASIGTGDTSVMTITLANPNATAATSVAFTDTYPASLANTASAGAATTCGGTVTGANNGTSLSLSGATIAANGSCTVTVNVTSATAGSYANSTGTITSANAGTATASGTLAVLAHPTVTKAFSPTQVALNGTSTLVFTLSNANASPITGVAFSDNYPANVQNAGTPSASSTCAGTSITAAANGTSIAVGGATIPSNGSCTVQVNVTPIAAGRFLNTLAAGAVTSTNAGSSAAAANATLDSQAPLTIAKTFSASTVGPNVPSTLTITLTNSNAVAVTGVAFTDTYPGGLANTATPAGATTCAAGTVTAAANGTSVAFSGGTVPANGSCTVTVNVAAAAVGSYTNTLAAGSVTATNAGPSTAAASDTLNVLAALTVGKSFNPPSIGVNDTSVMTITLTNGNATAVSGAAFTDTYPASLVNTASASGASSCGGTVTAANNGGSLALSGASIPAGGTCTITVNVTSASTGTYVNSTGTVTTTNAGSAAAASGTLTVLAHPTIAKSFGAAQVPVNGATLLTFTLSNTNATAVTGAAFTDTYPAGLQNAATPNASTTCAGASITAAANGNGISVGGATIPANGSCTVQVTVTPTATGSLVNTLAAGALTSANAGATTASSSATLTSMSALVIAKSFTTSPVGPNVPSALTITLTNNNAVAVTGVSFTDTYPAGLANTATPNGATTCVAGTVTAVGAGTTFTFSGGTVPANGSCTVTVNVAAAAAGSYTNTLAAGSVSSANAGMNTVAASGTLSVLAALTVAKSFSPASIGTGDTSVMTITLMNGNATAVTGVAFTDSYPASLANTASASAATTCGGTATGANNGTSLALSGATVPANGTCTVTVNVTSATPGTYVNSTGTVTSTNGGSAGPANGTLTVMAHPTIAKSFTPTQTGVNGTSTLVFTLGNSNAAAITGAAFTDNYPASLQNAGTPSASSTCAGASITAAANGTSIAVTAATIPANGSCTVQVNVTPTATGSFVNALAAGALTSTNAGSSTASATATLSVQSPPTATKAFAPANIPVNGSSALTITITNPNATGLTGVAFTDNYPAGLVNTGSPSAAISGAGCSGTLTAAAAGASLALAAGVVPANASCTITVNVTSNTPGAYVNSTGTITTTNGGSASAASGTLRVFATPTVTKQFAPTFIPMGGSSTMTITVTNPAANPANLTGVAISDTYPAGLTNNAAGSLACTSGGATLAGGTNGGTSIGLTAGTIPPGATCTLTQSVTTTAAISNTTSTATSNEAAAGTAASASLATSNSPTIDKQFSPATVALGGTSTITFTLTNPNPIALTGASFTDTLSGMQIDATGAAGGTCAGAGGNNFTAAQTSLAFAGLTVPASLSCTVTIVVRGTVVGPHNNTTSGLASNQAPTGPPSNTATLTVTATAPTITKAFSVSPINPGGTSTLTVTIANGNASSISITSVTDTFPAGMTAAASPNISNSCPGGTVTNTSGGVTLSGGTVAASGSCAFTIDVTSSTAGASLVNTIPVGALTTTAGSNAVAASATLDVRPEADLSITKTAAATVVNGGTITYTIVVSNAGPQAANGAQVTDNVPAAVTGVAASCGGATGGAACGTVNVSGNAVTSTITTLPSGGSVTFTVTGTAPSSGTVTNSASVLAPAGVSDPTDPNRTAAGNNTASVNTTVVAPDLRVTKTHSGSFVVGTPGVYTITVDNALGSAPTTGTITVTDTLPAGFTYSSATGTGWTCSAAGQVVTCTSSAVIAAGATNPNAVTLTVAVGSSAVGTVTNNVTVSGGGEPAANNGNNAAYDATLVVAAASNSFQPDNAQTAMPGTSVYYSHVFNAGSAGSVSFSLSTVTTPATAGWTQQIYRDTDCNGVLSAAESASVLSGAIAMNAGDTVCIIVKDNIPSTAAYNSTNQITVTAMFTGGLTYTRTDLTTVGAAGGAGLTLAKSVRNVTQGTTSGTSNTAKPNDVLEYTITYTNTSSGPLSAIVITDATPSFTTYQAATCGTPLPSGITTCSVTTAPAAGATGSIAWTFGGSLISSGSGTVVFTVKVNP